MSIFSPNLDKFSSSQFVHPADEVELSIVSVTLVPRKMKAQDDYGQEKEVTKYLLTFLFRVESSKTAGKEHTGKPLRKEFWLAEETFENDIQQPLRLAQAALGIAPGTDAADAQFKGRAASLDWSVNPEDLSVGEGWKSLEGKHVRSDVASKAGKGDYAERFNQVFKNWKPI